MNHPKQHSPLQLTALVAILCSFASVGIVALAFCLLRPISDGGMWAVAAMTAAPALLGIVVAAFLTQQPRPAPSSQT